jgi:hypothetical protein
MGALHFDLLHNNDLLNLDRWDGVGLNRMNVTGNEEQRNSFVLSVVSQGVIGELSFTTRLALGEQTNLSFDEIHFETKEVAIAPECIAVISDSGSRFNYLYTCGDGIIREHMKGSMLIKSVGPLPTSSNLTLELGDGVMDANFKIVNLLGAEVLRGKANRIIDVSRLESGTYFLKVRAGISEQSRRIVIQR